MEHILNATKSPQANGQVERTNAVLKKCLAKTTSPIDHADWVNALNQIEWSMNNAVHATTKAKPCILLFGTTQRCPDSDLLTEFVKDFQQNISIDLNTVREEAKLNIEKSQKYSQDRFTRFHKPAEIFKEGDWVAIEYTDTTLGKNKKLNPTHRGPYRIHRALPNDRYVIRDVENHQITNIPKDGVLEACKLRKWRVPLTPINDIESSTFTDTEDEPTQNKNAEYSNEVNNS